MKKITQLFFVLIALSLFSCDNSDDDFKGMSAAELEFLKNKEKANNGNNGDNVTLNWLEPGIWKSVNEEPTDQCGEPVECTLWAGQTIDAGSVTISNDDTYLYVKVYSKAGFQDVEENIKMWIGLTPPDSRPPSGHFPYKVTEDGTTHIFEIELSTLPEWDECGKSYVVIVHADVLTEEGNSGSGETAYGGCDGVQDQPWWAYMDYETQCCEEETETELGWLYKITYQNRVKCFESIFNEEVVSGFSNRYNYIKEDYEEGVSYPVYSNVMDNCDTSQITNIGSVTIYVLGFGTDQASVKLVFEANDGVDISYWQGYVGWIDPILDNGKFDSSLNDKTFGLSVTDGSGEIDIPVSTWAGDMNTAPLDGSKTTPQYFIISRFTQEVN